jgi:hypothetical protein
VTTDSGLGTPDRQVFMAAGETPGPSGTRPDRYFEDILADELSANVPADETNDEQRGGAKGWESAERCGESEGKEKGENPNWFGDKERMEFWSPPGRSVNGGRGQESSRSYASDCIIL